MVSIIKLECRNFLSSFVESPELHKFVLATTSNQSIIVTKNCFVYRILVQIRCFYVLSDLSLPQLEYLYRLVQIRAQDKLSTVTELYRISRRLVLVRQLKVHLLGVKVPNIHLLIVGTTDQPFRVSAEVQAQNLLLVFLKSG